MRRPARLLLIVRLLLASLPLAQPSFADTVSSTTLPESYIAHFFRAMVETATTGASEQSASNALHALITAETPLNETARFMLGRYWPAEKNPERASRFQSEFGDFVAEAVTHGLRAHPDATLSVLGSQTHPDGAILVRSQLKLDGASARAWPLDWILRDEGGRYRIEDFRLAGIGARIMLRQVAETVISEHQADGAAAAIDQIIPRLRARLGGPEPAPAP
jgi:ABC-type transporter MlaC component